MTISPVQNIFSIFFQLNVVYENQFEMHKFVSLRRVIHSGYTGTNGIFNQTFKKIQIISDYYPDYKKSTFLCKIEYL